MHEDTEAKNTTIFLFTLYPDFASMKFDQFFDEE